MNVVYGPLCYVNDYIWVKNNKLTFVKMTNLAHGD
jgi:hypothetical protein